MALDWHNKLIVILACGNRWSQRFIGKLLLTPARMVRKCALKLPMVWLHFCGGNWGVQARMKCDESLHSSGDFIVKDIFAWCDSCTV